MSPFCTSNSRTFPITGSTTLLFHLFFILIHTLPLSNSKTVPASTHTNTSEYVLSNVFQNKDVCYQESFVYVKSSDINKSSLFTTYSTTKECSARLKEDDLPESMPSCPPGLIDLEVMPTYVEKSQISWPYANLNISVMVHAPIDTVVFRLQCLFAADGKDVYCSDLKDMYIDGIKEWPCRGLRLSSKVKYPSKFSYSCFRMTPHSIYAINATVLPQKCRISTVITSPNFDDLFPEMLVDPSVSSKTIASTDPFWAPTISVDFSDENAIWIRLGKAPKAECDKIFINIYKEHKEDSGKITYLESLTVNCPETTTKWENQGEGNYILTAYVPIRNCKFYCEPDARGCTQCPRTHMNVFVEKTRASFTWHATQKFKDYGFEIFIGTAILIGIIFIISAIVLVIYCRKKQKESQRVREIQLTDFVKTLIVYADDNEHHTNCVKILVDNLRHVANCDPVFDLEKLITAERIVPSRWLIDQLSTLSKFIIVMSDCAEKILDSEASETHHIVQSRPFADLFEPAMNAIIREATHNSTASRNKYAIVRFNYSPHVPANLAVLNLPVFHLPDQFGHLTAFLHNLDHTENLRITQNISEAKIHEWRMAVAQQISFCDQNPNWIDNRWRPKDEQEVMSLKRLSPVVLRLENNADRVAASHKYNILPPQRGREDDEESQASTNERTFMIKPPRQRAPESEEEEEEEDEEEEDDEDEEEEQGSDTIVVFD